MGKGKAIDALESSGNKNPDATIIGYKYTTTMNQWTDVELANGALRGEG